MHAHTQSQLTECEKALTAAEVVKESLETEKMARAFEDTQVHTHTLMLPLMLMHTPHCILLTAYARAHYHMCCTTPDHT